MGMHREKQGRCRKESKITGLKTKDCFVLFWCCVGEEMKGVRTHYKRLNMVKGVERDGIGREEVHLKTRR